MCFYVSVRSYLYCTKQVGERPGGPDIHRPRPALCCHVERGGSLFLVLHQMESPKKPFPELNLINALLPGAAPFIGLFAFSLRPYPIPKKNLEFTRIESHRHISRLLFHKVASEPILLFSEFDT